MSITPLPSRRPWHIALSGLLVVASLVFGAETPAQAATTITVSGHAYLGDTSHPAGLGEVGISFLAFDSSRQPRPTSILTRTAADGSYSYAMPIDSYFAVQFEYLGSGSFVDGATGTSNYYLDPSIFHATADMPGIDYTLAPGAVLSGRILTAAGTPAGDQAVEVSVREFADPFSPLPTHIWPSRFTGADGTWAVPGLPAGAFRVYYQTAGIGPFFFFGHLRADPLRQVGD